MEKICIAKLRKRMTYAGHTPGEFGSGNLAGGERRPMGCSPAASSGSGSADSGAAHTEDRTVSLLLTQEQMDKLWSNRHLASSFRGMQTDGAAALPDRDEPVVIKFQFEPMPPVRLLKVEEVTEMLRISRSSLNKIVKEGELKSYKFGRLRRIMLGDVLSYLEDHREVAAAGSRAVEPKTAAAAGVKQSLIRRDE